MATNNNNKYYFSIGRRKTSIALIYIKKKKNNLKNKNENEIIINNKKLEHSNLFYNYFFLKKKILYPFILTDTLNKNYFINIKVKGGGFNGQLNAIILAISRCILKINNNFRKILKDKKLLTRDSRKVERKKYGRKKSRKKFQFSKR